MDLKEKIRQIVRLQQIDSQIHQLFQEKDVEKPEGLEKLKEEFEKEKRNLALFEEKVKQLQLKRKEKELELASKEENVKKAQSQLYQLKTNKEYQAKLSEIASFKADVSLLEEDVIKVLDEIEQAEKDYRTMKDRFAEEEKKIKAQEVKIREEIKEIEIKIKEMADKRSLISQDIDKETLSKYEQLLETRAGLAIVPVENESCGACHMRLTPQTINEIKMYKDFVFCENCVRCLYIPEDIELW
jgi:hypothetical protein